MTSRELVRSTLELASPKRIPRDMWLLPWAINNYPENVKKIQNKFPDDIIKIPPFYNDLPKSLVDAYKPDGDAYTPGIFVDEWSCIFEIRQKGLWGEVKKPLLKEWKDVDKVKIPDELLSINIDLHYSYL